MVNCKLTTRRIAAALAAFSVAITSSGQETDTVSVSWPERVVNFAETILDFLTIERDGWQLAIYPAASYSDRAGLAIGIMPMLQIDNSQSGKPTTITPSALISTKKMFEVQCDAEAYFRDGRNIVAKAEFYTQPDDYYAIGNADKDSALASYDISRYMLNCDFMQNISQSAWQIGLTLDATYHRFSEIDATTDVENEIKSASKWSNGLGIALVFDTRDNVLYPRDGWFMRLRWLGYAEWLGSRDDFTTFTVDGRRYLPVGTESLVALQAYWSGAWGDAPFHKMPAVGGTRLCRAIPHTYKYVDNYAWLLQAEFRFPIIWRIGATTFAGAGNVSHDIIDKILDDTHLMAGLGLRFKVFKDNGLNLRLDGGITSRGDHAVYFNIREAF